MVKWIINPRGKFYRWADVKSFRVICDNDVFKIMALIDNLPGETWFLFLEGYFETEHDDYDNIVNFLLVNILEEIYDEKVLHAVEIENIIDWISSTYHYCERHNIKWGEKDA
jgi:hypothetical protein